MTRKRRRFTDEFKQEAVRLTGLSVHPRRPIPPTPRATRGEKNFLFFVLFHVKHSGVRRAAGRSQRRLPDAAVVRRYLSSRRGLAVCQPSNAGHHLCHHRALAAGRPLTPQRMSWPCVRIHKRAPGLLP